MMWRAGCVQAVVLVVVLATQSDGLRTPPMGFSSWNHFGMGVTGELLLETADSFTATGLRDAGYLYINSDDGWLNLNRSAEGSLVPTAAFLNNTGGDMQNLVGQLHKKG